MLRAIPPLNPADVVYGQYDGYLDAHGVRPGSTTETYAALRLAIDSWRWAGVPWLVRTGKSLSATAVEVVVDLKPAPTLLFAGGDGAVPHPNHMTFSLGARPGVKITVHAKRPGKHVETQPVDLAVDFDEALGRLPDAYERLLADALAGDARRFARQDGVEEAWRIVQPLVGADVAVHPYAPGSMGPARAERILGPDGHGHDPA